ncbi:14-3-3 protein zeta-like [Aphis gossypii]|uniref:14-3-3 protein zeta-like n=1 Tax=Aphis gossypii TaxID=80765 RepID=UPI0021593A4B|nr:14-3-3 protein zeta-like [Aphis gossypii]
MEVEQEPVAAIVKTKEECLWKAKLAQEANRFEDMARYMRRVAECGEPMTKDEDNMMAAAYKHLLDTKRSSRRTLVTVEQKDGIASWEAAAARQYRERVDDELRALCTEVLAVVDEWLTSDRSNASDPATGVFYWKLCADYNRYVAEVIDDPGDRAAVVARSRAAYERADQIGRTALRPVDPVRLGLMLNYSVFLYQVCQQRRQGLDVAKHAFDEAVAQIDTIDDLMYDDSTLILRLIRDNLNIWIQENGGESYAAAVATAAAVVAGTDDPQQQQQQPQQALSTLPVADDRMAVTAIAASTVMLSLSPPNVESQNDDLDRQTLRDNVN